MPYTPRPPLLPRLLGFLLLLFLIAPPALAQGSRAPAGDTVVVATHEAPPFAVRGADGEWSGLAIDLWRGIGRDLGTSSRFEETGLAEMINGVASGHYDASVGALTVTPKRERAIDFTHPYYTTGFGIVTGSAPPGWLVLFRNFFTWSFLSAVLLLAGVLFAIGAVFWAVERRANPDQFEHGWRGIGSGFWFSAVTMTTVGYGDKAPRTAAGRAIAVVWMFAAIIIISTFTGLIASSLTESRIGGAIRGQEDLAGATVGSIAGSSSEDWLGENDIGFRRYPSITAGLDAVAAGEIQAFVYDRPILRYLVNRRGDGDLRLLPGTFGRQDYAFALPQGSPRREAINRALLQRIDSPEWGETVRGVLGREG